MQAVLVATSPHQIFHQRGAWDEVLLDERVEVGGDKDVRTIFPLGQEVPQAGC